MFSNFSAMAVPAVVDEDVDAAKLGHYGFNHVTHGLFVDASVRRDRTPMTS